MADSIKQEKDKDVVGKIKGDVWQKDKEHEDKDSKIRHMEKQQQDKIKWLDKIRSKIRSMIKLQEDAWQWCKSPIIQGQKCNNNVRAQ